MLQWNLLEMVSRLSKQSKDVGRWVGWDNNWSRTSQTIIFERDHNYVAIITRCPGLTMLSLVISYHSSPYEQIWQEARKHEPKNASCDSVKLARLLKQVSGCLIGLRTWQSLDACLVDKGDSNKSNSKVLIALDMPAYIPSYSLYSTSLESVKLGIKVSYQASSSRTGQHPI